MIGNISSCLLIFCPQPARLEPQSHWKGTWQSFMLHSFSELLNSIYLRDPNTLAGVL